MKDIDQIAERVRDLLKNRFGVQKLRRGKF
jgi:hypothetical protein